MKVPFLNRLKRQEARPKPQSVTPDLGRLNLKPAEPQPETPAITPDMQAWLQRDLTNLTGAWDVFAQDPSRHNWQDLAKVVHNLHGASGAYGGGALTRLTENLQRLVADHVCAADNKALINLHVQACQAWAIGNEEARTTLAEAVCEALEQQVRKAI